MIFTWRGRKVDMYFPLCIKINSKWIKTLIYNLNIEFIVENIGEIFQDLGRGRNLWGKKGKWFSDCHRLGIVY